LVVGRLRQCLCYRSGFVVRDLPLSSQNRAYAKHRTSPHDAQVQTQAPKPQPNSDGNPVDLPTHRRLASFLTAVQFGLGLHLSSLTNPSRVVRFLITPFDRAFDPTLAFLALGALPVATISYFYGRGDEKPRLGGEWTIPKGGEIDWRLLVGAAIFGIGWGIDGLCRTFDILLRPV
jgi:hypothetical protein